MTRKPAARGKGRQPKASLTPAPPRPLIQTDDHGDGAWIDGTLFGAEGDRWIEPFLAANRQSLTRLAIAPQVEMRQRIGVRLVPGPRIGAVPLLSPRTRRVTAGLLVSPRFRWAGLGAVLTDIAFALEPNIGAAPMVPGSARAVPIWLLAAPVLRRLEALLRRRKRGFIERHEDRQSPRGRVDWTAYAARCIPTGQWGRLPCRFTDPADDPDLLAAVRWTLRRLADSLDNHRDSPPARLLRVRVADLLTAVGPGVHRRPGGWAPHEASAWVAEGKEAMGWIAEERGLGGARSLDGLSWDLPIEAVWEAWVQRFIAELAPRCGFVAVPAGQTVRTLHWQSPIASMGRLIPDSGMRGPDRMVWVDAKYKAHLQLIARLGWDGVSAGVREAHRSDLHQALAYASLDDAAQVDSLLVYPELGAEGTRPPAIATLPAGRRRVRLMLMGLPFGFRSEDHRQATLTHWRDVLAAA